MQLISDLLEHPALLAYFIGADNYTWLHFRSGEQKLLAKSLLYFEKQLPQFLRVHKTALINPSCVVGLVPPPRLKMAGQVRMLDGVELAVSRRRWAEVAALLEPILNANARASIAAPVSLSTGEPRRNEVAPVHVMAVMQGDAVRLTRVCLESLDVPATLHSVEFGAELASMLALGKPADRPALILLDARTHRADRTITLRALKGHPQLRAIPVIWLAEPTDDFMATYALDANSVVAVPADSASFASIIEQLCRYWLTIARLPPAK